jgi:hypothetical protein
VRWLLFDAKYAELLYSSTAPSTGIKSRSAINEAQIHRALKAVEKPCSNSAAARLHGIELLPQHQQAAVGCFK